MDDGPLVAIAGGLPAWIDGIADTRCIATHGSAAALADRKGNLYISADTGRSWSRQADGLPPRAASSSWKVNRGSRAWPELMPSESGSDALEPQGANPPT